MQSPGKSCVRLLDRHDTSASGEQPVLAPHPDIKSTVDCLQRLHDDRGLVGRVHSTTDYIRRLLDDPLPVANDASLARPQPQLEKSLVTHRRVEAFRLPLRCLPPHSEL
jgi:hypothetical protein